MAFLCMTLFENACMAISCAYYVGKVDTSNSLCSTKYSWTILTLHQGTKEQKEQLSLRNTVSMNWCTWSVTMFSEVVCLTETPTSIEWPSISKQTINQSIILPLTACCLHLVHLVAMSSSGEWHTPRHPPSDLSERTRCSTERVSVCSTYMPVAVPYSWAESHLLPKIPE